MNIKKAAVIGNPISHSKSPIIHNFFLEKYKINATYEAIKMQENDFDNSIANLINQDFSGFNVTLPFKEKIYTKCDHLSKSASLTKAVNTVVITKDKKLFGHNSDIEGFLNNLKYQQEDFDLKNKNCYVIGAGGAARAIIYGLIKSEVKQIVITNRNEQRAQNLINDFLNFAKEKKCEILFMNKDDFEKNLDNCDLLINSSSLGMKNQDKLELNINSLKKAAIVYDIVYQPLMTDLLVNAKNNGNKIVTGLGMLVFQALIGFELFFNKEPETKYISELFEKCLEQ